MRYIFNAYLVVFTVVVVYVQPLISLHIFYIYNSRYLLEQVVSAKVAAARAGRDLVLSTGRYLGQVLGHKVGSTVQYITTLHYNITLPRWTWWPA